ncbi:hypothetical protein Pchl3084_3474 [Pseudomonas chlororaphis subsp. aureofaciens 30-84]|nr:hypothetical protein Pchl3084_3474 [Pseudomonas chlororaphis subsp. aureofaciens 30-84]
MASYQIHVTFELAMIFGQEASKVLGARHPMGPRRLPLIYAARTPSAWRWK